MRTRPLALIAALGALAAQETAPGADAPEVAAETTLVEPVLATEPEIQVILARALEQGLDADPYWLVLLHYADDLIGRSSRVDDAGFFLAKNGAQDPRAELIADLRAFLGPRPKEGPAAGERFPARLDWLCNRLGLDRTRLAATGSPEFEEAFARLAPREAWLVFPAAYMNTPASMFGHTLLIIRSRYQSALLSQAINYAAVTTESNGIVFAFKGIFGMYPGYFSLLPYYQKVQQYTDLDQRDIWEYRLAFGPDEIRRMLLHTWELRGIASDYWFFDENCSYNLLYLIDSAREGLDLHARTSSWVIPLDTVKSVGAAGLIAEAAYRPSRGTRVRHYGQLLDPASRSMALDIADGRLGVEAAAPIADDVLRAQVLEVAAERLQMLRGRRKIGQEAFQPRLFAILSTRASIEVPPFAVQSPMPAPARPDLSHGSHRLVLGGGRDGDGGFFELGFRPAYHDLRDPPAGFLPGTQIEFFNGTLRAYTEDSAVELQDLQAISLRSFTAVDAFGIPPSWKIDAGVVRELTERGDRHDGRFVLGVGLSTRVPRGALVYCLGDLDARWTSQDPNHTVGVGGEAGLYAELGTQALLLDAHVAWMHYPLGETATNWEGAVGLRWVLTEGLALTADLSRRSTWEAVSTVAGIRALLYF